MLETDALRWTLPVHSDILLLVSLYYDGRSDRASLQESYCFAGDGRPSLDTIVCPYISLLVLLYYNGRPSLDTTVLPYRSRIALLETDALRWRLPVCPYISLLVSLYYDGRSDQASLQESYCFAGDWYSLARHEPCVPTEVVLL